MDMSGHSHSHGASSSMMDMSQMQATFFTSQTTALYSTAWTPSSPGTYAATCIFLIVLATIFRCLMAGKYWLERRWQERYLQRAYIKVRGKPTEADAMDTDGNAKDGRLVTANGVEQDVRVVRNRMQPAVPFRLSVDVPRAAYVTVIAGVAYLLMLAVMTLNVGYFLSVLGGIFLGELAVGRYVQSFEH